MNSGRILCPHASSGGVPPRLSPQTRCLLFFLLGPSPLRKLLLVLWPPFVVVAEAPFFAQSLRPSVLPFCWPFGSRPPLLHAQALVGSIHWPPAALNRSLLVLQNDRLASFTCFSTLREEHEHQNRRVADQFIPRKHSASIPRTAAFWAAAAALAAHGEQGVDDAVAQPRHTHHNGPSRPTGGTRRCGKPFRTRWSSIGQQRQGDVHMAGWSRY